MNSGQIQPSGVVPTSRAETRSGSGSGLFTVGIYVGLLIAAGSVIGLSAAGTEIGEPLWVASVFGIGVGVVLAFSSYYLGNLEGYKSLVTEQQRQFEESYEQNAGRDWITGLDTYSEFQKLVDRELSRSERYKREFTVLFTTPKFEGPVEMLESEHVTSIEVYTSDLLRKVLRLSDGTARRTDVFGFVSLLPETGVDGGNIAATRVSEALENPYQVGPWEHRTQMTELQVEALSFPEDKAGILARFQIEDPSAGGGQSVTLPPNI